MQTLTASCARLSRLSKSRANKTTPTARGSPIARTGTQGPANVSTIVVGELKGIRTDKDWKGAGNRRLHARPFSKIVSLLTYKAALAGIRAIEVPEKSTITTCPACGKRAKKARVKRGLFIHCECAFNADMVGAYNILRRYLREAGLALSVRPGVVGALARPAVNLFVWRKTTPEGREQGAFRQAAQACCGQPRSIKPTASKGQPHPSRVGGCQSNSFAQRVVDAWWELGRTLVSRYHDGYVDGKTVGYPEEWLKTVGYGPLSKPSGK